MIDLSQIKTEPKSGEESFLNQSQPIGYKLLDFWRWSVSDLVSNATRGRLAEFIVGTSIGISSEELRDEWDAFDLKTKDGIKIEVKSAAYLQSWGQKALSKISFSIKHTRAWEGDTNPVRGNPLRHADVYVFCHLKHTDKSTLNPLNLEQWDFYIIPTFLLNDAVKSQRSITLNSLQLIAKAHSYSALKEAIYKAYSMNEHHLKTLGTK
jgi:hypothetical protein